MKQLISVPSTKPDQALYTDFSIVSPIDHPKHSLNRILVYIKNVLKMRVYLCFGDIEELYQNEATIFNRILGVYSCEQLWRRLVNNGDNLQERQIVGFMTKLIIGLVRQKNELAEAKKYDQFAEIRGVIEWLEDKVVELQSIIRDRIKETTIQKRLEAQNKRQLQFALQVNYAKKQLLANLQSFQANLTNKHESENYLLNKVLNQSVKDHAHLYKPSKHLNQAKDNSLLTKLAPFKSQKKRSFQCKCLQSKLMMSAEKAKDYTNKQIEEFQLKEKQRIKRRQRIERSSYLSRLQDKKNLTLAKIEQKKNEVHKSETIKLQKLESHNNKETKERVEFLRKSLRAYSMRDDTRQISNIIKTHRQQIQYANNVQLIGDTSLHSSNGLSKQYVTLDFESDWSKKQRFSRYSDEKIEKKIIRKIRNQSVMDRHGEDNGFKSGRNSLVDLYDKDLKQF